MFYIFLQTRYNLCSVFFLLEKARFLQKNQIFSTPIKTTKVLGEEVMSKKVFSFKSFLQISVLGFSICLINGCAVSAKSSEETSSEKTTTQSTTVGEKSPDVTKNSTSKSRIKITAGSPADTVRIFYKNLRERRFKEAMMMTNLHFAVEGLSDAEMQDLNNDFEPLAAQVPADIEIKGEIITNNLATVNANMPNPETGQLELTEVKLRREKDVWLIITADEQAEALAKKEGKNYFFMLRMDIHHAEAQIMMERIAKAQTLHAAQNGGNFADLNTLVSMQLLPEDINTARSTGYRFTISVVGNNKKYFANAVPDVYGKTGKLSFLLEADGNDQKARLKSDDNKGQPIKK